MYTNIDKERPLPSWKALEWLAEDYGQSVTEEAPYDKIYEKISIDWQQEPSVIVSINNYFCLCERRHKWNLEATIDSIEYNWPKLSTSFDTPASCSQVYGLSMRNI
jgi:hypothetical protein